MSTLLLVAGFIAVLLIAFVATVLYVRRNPLAAFTRMTRTALRRIGMVRREVVSGGQRIVYWAGGRGSRPMILLHGVNDQAGSWVSVLPMFTPSFRVIAIDLPGHGESEPQTGPLPLERMVEAVDAVVDAECGGTPAVFVGNSMGGWVAMLYAAAHPEKVERLVLEDASGMAWDLRHVPVFPKTREEAVALLGMVHGPKPSFPSYLVDSTIRLAPTLPQARVFAAGIVGSLVDPHLAKLTMPVTLVWGENDGLLPMPYAEALKSRIPGSMLHVITGAAHIPHRQKPAEFASVLTEATRA